MTYSCIYSNKDKNFKANHNLSIVVANRLLLYL